jgi:hypothetical protein
MPVATVFSGGFALNNNPPPSSGGGMPNRMLPLMGVGLLSGLLLKIAAPFESTRWRPEVSLGLRS